MNFNKIRSLSVIILSAGLISSCATSLEKSEIADYEALNRLLKYSAFGPREPKLKR
jgi:ferritin-like metal-binding protein YciE